MSAEPLQLQIEFASRRLIIGAYMFVGTHNQNAAAECIYCGGQFPDGTPTCPDCGTSLVRVLPSAQSEPKRKSKGLAVFLALVFGPLGLLYVGALWPALLMILIGTAFILTHTGGLWMVFGSRILATVWAYGTIVEQNEAPDIRGSKRLLNEAAGLERTDRAKAIATYEQILRLYPNTPASGEAARNLQALGAQSSSF
jgi:hypothetical protein